MLVLASRALGRERGYICPSLYSSLACSRGLFHFLHICVLLFLDFDLSGGGGNTASDSLRCLLDARINGF